MPPFWSTMCKYIERVCSSLTRTSVVHEITVMLLIRQFQMHIDVSPKVRYGLLVHFPYTLILQDFSRNQLLPIKLPVDQLPTGSTTIKSTVILFV